MAMTYDRRAPGGLMDALMDGFASSLKDYVLAHQYPVDLQLRGYEGKNQNHATLYVGLTKVLDLHFRPEDKFKLSAHASYAKAQHGWQDEWTKLRPTSWWEDRWEAVDEYLDTIIPKIGTSYLKEGRTQAAVNTLRNETITVIDREVVVAFANAAERTAITKPLQASLLEPLQGAHGAAWWEKTMPKSLGNECDALAVRDGELLAVEIKPASASAAAIAWSPLQVQHYANLLRKWATTHPTAAQIIEEMVQQRVELGLCPAIREPVRRPLEVRPVVVLQHGCSAAALDRMNTVRRALAAVQPDRPQPEVLVLTAAGRLKPLPMG